MARILVLCSRLPYPPIGGARLRMFNTAKILSEEHTVDILAINEGTRSQEDFDALQNQFNNVTLFNYPTSKFHLNTVPGLVSSRPLQTFYYYFDRVQEWVNKNEEKYDLLYCNHVRTAEYARDLEVPMVVDLVDAISRNYSEAKDGASGLWKWIYAIDSDRLLRYERTIIEEADRSFIISPEDRGYITKNASLNSNPVVLPNGVREKFLKFADEDPTDVPFQESNAIVFLGKMDYFPNEDAAEYFAKEVFPDIRKQCSRASFIIVGMNPTEKIQALEERPGVQVTGFVEEPLEYLNAANVVVAPIRFGAGVQNKILEAMALSKPVVTTSLGREGIDATDSVALKTADDPSAFASATVDLLTNKQQRNEMGEQARACIEKNYTWQNTAKILLQQIDEVLYKDSLRHAESSSRESPVERSISSVGN